MSIWRLAWRLVRFRPWLFTVSFALWVGVHSLPVTTGLMVGWFFGALSGDAPAGLNVWTVIGLLAATEAVRMVVFFGAVNVWDYNWNLMQMLMHANMLAWIVEGAGVGQLPSSTGEAISRFRDDAEEFADFIDTWLDVAGSALFTAVAVVIMARIDPLITLVVLAPVVATIVFTQLMTSRIKRYRAVYRRTTAEVTGFIGESFGAVQALKVASAEERATGRFRALGDDRREAAVKDRLFTEVLASYSMNAGNLGVGVVLLLAVGSMQSGAFTVGDFALFASYLMWLTGLPRWIGWLLARQKQASVSVDRMTRVLQGAPSGALVAHRPLPYSGTPNGVATAEPDRQRAPFETLEVRGLSYLHPASGRGVRDIDLSLRRGSFVVITGRVGAGKTTLLRALLGLTERDAGDLRWNGAVVDDPAHFFVPPRCAYTPQSPRLFSETLRDNIVMGGPSDDGALADALRLAVIDGDIAAMEHGLNTVVGTRGLRLSGGQVQRAATARMLVRIPDLLVFDDVSSALDVETERQLWEGLLEHREATYLLVSNRRTALSRADEIVLLKDGAVEDRGTLEELLRDSAEMRALWRDADSLAPDRALEVLD